MSNIDNIINNATKQLDNGNITAAIEVYLTALNTNIAKKYIYQLNYALGVAYYNKGLLNEANECFSKSANNNYRISDSFNYMGLIEKNRGNTTLAEEHYLKALQNNSKNIFVINNLANIFIIKGETSQAKKLLIEASKLQKNNPIPRYNLMKLAMDSNDSQIEEFRQEYLEKSLNQIYYFENEEELKYSNYKKELETIVGRYIESMKTTDIETSKKLLDSILSESKSLKEFKYKTKKAIGSLHVRKANALLILNEYDAAIKEYTAAIDILGPKSSILVNMSICLNNTDKTVEAVSYLKKLENNNDVTGLIAKCNLATIAFDENSRITHDLKESKEYFRQVLKKLREKSFNQIDNSRFQVSEATIKGTNSEKCFVFRRATSNDITKKIFEKEQEALKRFYHSSNELNLKLKVVRPLGIVENIRGYNNIILTRGTGNHVLEEILNLKKENNNKEIELIFDNLVEEFVKVRIIGNYSCKDLLDKVHLVNKESNILLYQNLITNKFIGTKDYSGSIYRIINSKKADSIASAIENDYHIISEILAYQNEDFYKDMSLKNILTSNKSFIHIDFETMKNFPFVLDIATALNMGNFVSDKDSLTKKIYDKNNEMTQILSFSNENLGTLEEFTIALHAAGVQRGLIHHASFSDWYSRLQKEEYKNLAKDSLVNSINDLIWLKENCRLDFSKKDKIYSLYNLLAEIYN